VTRVRSLSMNCVGTAEVIASSWNENGAGIRAVRVPPMHPGL
jgi:hypothetical protein